MSEASAGQVVHDIVGEIGTLTRLYRPALLRYFLRRGVVGADADDLVQQVFLRMCQRGSSTAIRNIDGYLFATAASVMVEYIRYRAVRRDNPDHDHWETLHREQVADPERLVGSQQELSCVLTALAEMPERMRQIFILARLENLNRAEIARRFGVSKRLVEQQITLATACLADRRSRAT